MLWAHIFFFNYVETVIRIKQSKLLQKSSTAELVLKDNGAVDRSFSQYQHWETIVKRFEAAKETVMDPRKVKDFFDLKLKNVYPNSTKKLSICSETKGGD